MKHMGPAKKVDDQHVRFAMPCDDFASQQDGSCVYMHDPVVLVTHSQCVPLLQWLNEYYGQAHGPTHAGQCMSIGISDLVSATLENSVVKFSVGGMVLGLY